MWISWSGLCMELQHQPNVTQVEPWLTSVPLVMTERGWSTITPPLQSGSYSSPCLPWYNYSKGTGVAYCCPY